MGNMTHCRFENTYGDLQDCLDELREQGSIQNTENECNQYDKQYVRSLVELCKEIADEFADELED